MQLYKGLPIYFVDINDETIFNNISIVDCPAIQEDFIKLAKEVEIQFKVNEEKRIVSGPVLIPEQPIYRRSADGKEYYIKFDEKSIREFAVKFFKDHRNTEGNVQHQFAAKGITFFESYLLNRERGIVPAEFNDLPDGTWFVSARIDNDELWSLIKDGTLRGFSVDILTTLSEEREIDSLEDLLEYLNKQ